MADKKISQLPEQTTLTPSAVLVGVDVEIDSGELETVKIPISKFVKQNANGDYEIDGNLYLKSADGTKQVHLGCQIGDDGEGKLFVGDGIRADNDIEILNESHLVFRHSTESGYYLGVTEEGKLVFDGDEVALAMDIPSDGGNSGGGGGIVTVDALPTEGKEDTIYRLAIEEMKMIEFSEDGTPYASEEITVEVVNALPAVGNPFMNVETGKAYVYYSKTDGAAMAYATEELAAEMGATAGWYNWLELMGGTEQTKTVIVSSLSEVGEQGSLYLLSISSIDLYHYYNGKYIKLVDEEDKGSASGGGIIDVTELPTANINTSAIYRVQENVSATCYFGREDRSSVCPIEVVDGLPETGNPCVIDMDTNKQYAYYNTQDNKVYAYVTQELYEQSEGEFASAGWTNAGEFWEQMNFWGGIVNSVDEITEENILYVLLSGEQKKVLYYHDGNEFVKIITSKDFEFDETTGTLVLNL